MDILIVLGRTLFFYFFILFSYRVMGKREIGQLSISDLTISILIAELVAISIENRNDATILTIIPILLLVFLEVLLAFIQLKFNRIRVLMDGKPSLIIRDGKLNVKEMVKQRYSLDDLLLSLRQKEIRNIEDVEYAFLEPNGKLSIFKYNFFKLKSDYPMPLIVDGSIQKKALKYIRKTTVWLEQELKSKKLEPKDIFYAFYKKGKIYLVKKNETLK